MRNSFSLFVAAALTLVVTIGCSSKNVSTTEAQKQLEEKWAPTVGKATKAQFVEQYGDAEWCKPDENTGEETCRFYLKKGTKWIGDKKDRKHFEQGDDVVASFDTNGILKSFKAKAQR